jgi:hypothetical protein
MAFLPFAPAPHGAGLQDLVPEYRPADPAVAARISAALNDELRRTALDTGTSVYAGVRVEVRVAEGVPRQGSPRGRRRLVRPVSVLWVVFVGGQLAGHVTQNVLMPAEVDLWAEIVCCAAPAAAPGILSIIASAQRGSGIDL